MKEKEKLTNEIEARLGRIDEVIDGLRQKAAEEKHIDPGTDERIRELTRKRNEMHGKLEALQQSDENTWEKLRSELNDFMDDLDNRDRQAFSHWK